MNAAYSEFSPELKAGLFMMASRLLSYPQPDAQNSWKEIAVDYELLGAANTLEPEAWGELVEELRTRLESSQGILDWCSEYIETFETGKESNPLNETEYGRGRSLAKGSQLADIQGFYRAFGFELDLGTANELPDHVAVELEFMSLLFLKESFLNELGDAVGLETLRDARAKFLKDHLATFALAMTKRPGIQRSRFFYPVVTWLGALLENECALAGVQVSPVEYILGESEPETVCCAASPGAAGIKS